MTGPRVLEIVRHFRENGLKLLLQNPVNARDLLALTGTNLLARLDFDRMTVDPATYVASDYRHVSSDLVLRVPFRGATGSAGRRALVVYVLIEHQSEPERLMLLRVLDYLVQIWKAQLRDRRRRAVPVRLQPVLPVVLYTGLARWDDLGRLVDVIEGGELFGEVTPDYRPLFLSLPALPRAALESSGGALGWVLELVQQRRARPQEFRDLLRRVVAHLETMPAADRLRWLELLSYVQALVYHDRESSEHKGLRELIVASVATDDHRQEMRTMGQSMADMLREEGRKEGEVRSRQDVLLVLLRERFESVPKAVERTIRATADVGQLTTWLRRVVSADSLAEVGIGRER
jgi:predicted transposase YdaD